MGVPLTETTILGVRVQFIYDTNGQVVGIILPDTKPDGFTPVELTYNYGTTLALATAAATLLIAGLQ